jgi:hypothetical protein
VLVDSIVDVLEKSGVPYSEEMSEKIKGIGQYVSGLFKAEGKSQMRSIIEKNKGVYDSLHTAYTKSFGFRAATTPFQELYFPSEVICMLASMELGKNKYVANTLAII